MTKPKNNISAAVLLSVLFPLISAPGAYAQVGAYANLSAGAEAVNVPLPKAPRRVSSVATASGEKSFASRESQKIIKMSDAALAAATPDQRIQMLRTLISDSRPNNNNNNDSTDWDQENLEKAILRVLSSAPDAASFDYVYYRVGKDKLEYSVSWYGDIEDIVKRYRGGVTPGDWDGLTRYVNTVARAVPSGRNYIKFLIDGKDAIPMGKEVFGSAQKSINIEVFQLQADEVGRGFADLLSAKAKAGVKVRMIIGEHGSNLEHDHDVTQLMNSMRANGIDIRVRPAPHMEKHLDHRKVMVIDGKVGFTGGMNIGRSYQVDWHDQQTLVRGPAVAKLQQSFVDHWKAVGGSFGADEDLFPAIDEDPEGVQTEVITHTGWEDQNIKAMYLRAIGTAQKSIKIANPYFTDKDVIDALRAASRRGVKVLLVLPQDNDMAIVQHASRASYPKLVKAGVQVYEYKGRMAHEKVAVFDGHWATFGSSNLDERSLKNNDELNLVIDDYRLGQDIELRLFDADLPNCELMNNYSPSLLDHMANLVNGML